MRPSLPAYAIDSERIELGAAEQKSLSSLSLSHLLEGKLISSKLGNSHCSDYITGFLLIKGKFFHSIFVVSTLAITVTLYNSLTTVPTFVLLASIMAQPDMDVKGTKSLKGKSLKRKSVLDTDETIQTACKKVHLDRDEDVDREANTSVAEEDLKTAQPGLDEQDMEAAAGSSWNCTRHETTQEEDEAFCK